MINRVSVYRCIAPRRAASRRLPIDVGIDVDFFTFALVDRESNKRRYHRADPRG